MAAPKVVETVEFDADIHASRLGRLVKVRHRDEGGELSEWSHGVCTWAETQSIEKCPAAYARSRYRPAGTSCSGGCSSRWSRRSSRNVKGKR